MTFTIDNRSEIPLHPLDLTAYPPQDSKSDFCVGLIQVDNTLARPDSSIGDMILGVPFLRNVYKVMAYTPPNNDGSFPPRSNSTGISNTHINPRLGLMSLTNATKALDEFQTVRVLKRPISSGISSPNTTSINYTKTVNIGRLHLSMGVVVLLGLIVFMLFCGFLFCIRWLYIRRKFSKNQSSMGNEHDEGIVDRTTAYSLVRGSGNETPGILSEDALREIRFRAYKRKEKTSTDSTVSSNRTRVGSLSFGKRYGKEGEDGNGEDEFEFAVKRVSGDEEEVWDPRTGLNWGDDTYVQRGNVAVDEKEATIPLALDRDCNEARNPTTYTHRPLYSDPDLAVPFRHKSQKSISVPLLSAQHHDQPPPNQGAEERVTEEINHTTYDQVLPISGATIVPPPLPSDSYFFQETDSYELGVSNGTSMAGVGTALRTSKVGWT